MITSILGAVLLIACLVFTGYSLYHEGKKILALRTLTTHKDMVSVTPGLWPKVKLAFKLFWYPVVWVCTMVYIVFLFVMQAKRTLGL